MCARPDAAREVSFPTHWYTASPLRMMRTVLHSSDGGKSSSPRAKYVEKTFEHNARINVGLQAGNWRNNWCRTRCETNMHSWRGTLCC